MKLRKWFLFGAGVLLLAAFATHSPAQSIISGDVTGIVTDATNAAIPGAAVTLTDIDTGVKQTSTTNAAGSYRFAFVAPGAYNITASAKGFRPLERTGVIVVAGQPTAVNIPLQVATTTQEVTVEETTSVLQTENADVTTTYNQHMVEDLPNPGGDLTYLAQTSPGAVMNTQSGYGNFSADGMPGISNLYTINGQNYNDPFLNLNNSGASNLLLGSNDIAEANVINNAYSGQYGQFAGSQITYITKSGTNKFHGDAVYNWNGRALNANQFFSNESGQPTPFNNFNQWQVNLNGPIWKNKTFFDFDYEGLHSLLPTSSQLTLVPSPQFQAATLTNLASDGNAAEIPFYQKVFSIYNNAPGVGSAVPAPAAPGGGPGCQGLSLLGDTTTPCALQFRTTPPNIFTEYQWSARVDHVINDKDRFYVRVLRDNGFQPTYTSPLGPTFNALSHQPQMTGAVSEVHTFGPNTVNQFNASGLFYSAIFQAADASGALAALPTFMTFSGTPFSPVGADEEFQGGAPFFFTQGRRVFQYQVLDDLSHVHGKHTFRVGFSWLHQTVTDLDFEQDLNGQISTTLPDFFHGGGPDTSLLQYFPSSSEEGLNFNTLGGYVADDWKVTDRLNVSLNLRLEHYANPTCDADCFSRLTTAFSGAPQPSAVGTPYNQLLISGQKNAYANTQTVVWEPRIGIAWRPSGTDNTVIRAGGGIFADELPGVLAEYAAFNAPGFNAFTIGNGNLAPGAPGSLFTTAANANKALLGQFASNGSFNSISSTVPGFAAPTIYNFPNTFNQPTYYKWNFEVEQALGHKMVLTLNYSGMHGIHIPVDDEGLNAYCPLSVCASGFAGLPAAPPNAALGAVYQYLSAGTSNYNGVTISLQRRLSQGLSFALNYTWSHALDDVSNGGISNEPYGALVTDGSVVSPQNPFNIRANYGPSDYDVRHYLSANFVVTDMFRHAGMKWGPSRVFGGWTLSSNWFFRTGLPFTVVDSSATAPLFGLNAGINTQIFASPVTNVGRTCNNAVNSPCLVPAQFAPAANNSPTGFGTMGRNSVYGPHFFDVDMSLMKDVQIREHIVLSFGAQAYNLLNHPNFDQPVNDISNPNFGSSIGEVGPPTSLLGSFVGAGSSPRFVELKALVRF
jgi:hypothetical protein